jgi:ferredoxin
MGKPTTGKRKDGYQIIIDRETCIGAASCVTIAPGVYQLDEEGKSFVLDPDEGDLQTVIDGAKSCPVAAIRILDPKGVQVWPEV